MTPDLRAIVQPISGRRAEPSVTLIDTRTLKTWVLSRVFDCVPFAMSVPSWKHSLPRLLPLLLLALSLSSCAGPGFGRAWKKAESLPEDGVCGQWEGTWLSDVNGHHGKLRCIVTPPATPDGPHQFYYHATWMRILSGAYRAEHQVKPAGLENWTFTGKHRMPSWAGGLYHYEGRIHHGQFEAAYRCEIDRGNYRLKRPGKVE